ncbi:PREDICTED: gastrokine-1, partial [Leptosomus discolor]|uniref:gastrokine-1 n=1 Tax=Leptosomus discolor TaxID=188344 RepID=UPI0005223C2C
ILIAALLGVFLAPALADWNSKENLEGYHGENSHHSDSGEDSGSSSSEEHSEGWVSAWDSKTGYVATKVLSKNTCVIAKLDNRFPLDGPYAANFEGHKGPHKFLPRDTRFIVSRNRLQSLRPYGTRIQDLCRGIPSYFAYPAPGEYDSNNVLYIRTKIITRKDEEDLREDEQVNS